MGVHDKPVSGGFYGWLHVVFIVVLSIVCVFILFTTYQYMQDMSSEEKQQLEEFHDRYFDTPLTNIISIILGVGVAIFLLYNLYSGCDI